MRKRLAQSAAAVLVTALVACSQATTTVSRYGLPVVSSRAAYEKTVSRDPEKRMVELTREIPGILLDIRYATPDNFTHTTLYPEAAAFLRLPAANALADVERDLASEGLGLKVFDAYRPYAITEKMWEPIRNPDFVADPAKGSRHNRGCAVDVTLITLADGAEIPMPTAYDSFSSQAAQTFDDLPAGVRANRDHLREVMQRHGFAPFASEWWHFDYKGWERFEVLDLPFFALR